MYANSTPGRNSGAMVSLREVAPVERTRAGEIPGTPAMSPDSSLFVKTFWAMEMKSAPPA